MASSHLLLAADRVEARNPWLAELYRNKAGKAAMTEAPDEQPDPYLASVARVMAQPVERLRFEPTSIDLACSRTDEEIHREMFG